MFRLARNVLLVALIAGVLCQSAVAAVWTYHPTLSNNPPYWYDTGTLDVWGTINCVAVNPPLFHGFVQSCHTYWGSLPWWANDYATRLVQSGCGNTYYSKTAVPRYDPTWPPRWYFRPLNEWVEAMVTVENPIVLPSLGDPTTAGSEVYSFVYLDQWYADQRPLLPEYQVTDGLCEDLPYHRFSSTPFVFRPDAGPGEDPFYWTPIASGTFVNGATITMIPEPAALSLLGLGALTLLRRR